VGADQPADSHGTTLRPEGLIRIGGDPRVAPDVLARPDSRGGDYRPVRHPSPDGIAGNGRRVTFRTLHVVSFREGLIRREQVWIDTGAITAQLTAA
jgi:hypothetical protein